MTCAKSHLMWLPLALLAVGCTPDARQSQPAAPPDISGVWNRYPAYADTFSKQPDPPELQLVEPPLKEPYLSQWRALRQKRADADAAGNPLPTPSALCKPEGAPGIMGAHYALQILQNPAVNQITVLGEFMSQIRRIYMNEKMPAVDNINPGYFGYSVGRWDGKVLTVTTQGVREDVLYEDIPHSSAMKIVERIHLKDNGILVDDFTIEDSQYLTRPYKFTVMLKREAPSYKIAEYVCENQHSVIKPDGSLDMKVESSDSATAADFR